MTDCIRCFVLVYPYKETDNEMARRIVKGQRVDPVKVQRSRELRQAMTAAKTLLWWHLQNVRLEET